MKTGTLTSVLNVDFKGEPRSVKVCGRCPIKWAQWSNRKLRTRSLAPTQPGYHHQRPRHCTPEPVLAATGRALADVAFFSKRAIRYRYQSVVPMFEASRNPDITRDTLLKRRFEISQKFGFWTICIWTICLWMICKNLDDLRCDVTKTSPEITPKNLIERLYELRKVVHGMNDAVDICTRCLTSN